MSAEEFSYFLLGMSAGVLLASAIVKTTIRRAQRERYEEHQRELRQIRFRMLEERLDKLEGKGGAPPKGEKAAAQVH